MAVICLVDHMDTEKTTKKNGDIIVAKLEDAPWGNEEIKNFNRIKLDASGIQADLEDMEASGVINPTITYPYKNVDASGNMMNRSVRRFDFDSFSDNTASLFGITKDELKDTVTEKPILWKKKDAGHNANFIEDDLIFDDLDR
jgi:hypothetical protein